MNLYEILQNPDRVGEGMTHFERLFAQKVGGGKINEISGVPPLRYIGNGRPLTDYLISGNAIQDGTPSADAPVDAVGSGVRTGNLVPPLAEWVDGYVASNTGGIAKPSPVQLEKVTELLPVPEGSSNLTFSAEDGAFEPGTSGAWRAVGFFDRDGAFISRPGGNGANAATVTVPEGAVFMRICCRTYGSDKNYMLNLGSTALPYEPYGYKLPLTVNGTEYPIYLGTVPTTRQIKKLVLTGEETSWNVSNGFMFNDIIQPDYLRSQAITLICSHYRAIGGVGGGSEVSNGQCALYRFASVQRLYIRDNNYTTVEAFKSYLSAQYAAGTPVTVWYVLAESETAIVNEPLMKIGDYADTISFAQSQVAIPTVNGENVLDVPTTVPPSEVWIRGRIKEV